MEEQYQSFRYLVIKDPHLMFGFKNRIRKSGWEADIDSKLNQIITYCQTNSIKTILLTGDISEKSRKRDWSLNQMLQNKKRLRLFKKAGIELISNMGNHDYFDGHEAIHDTAFGEYVESGLLTYIGSNSVKRYIELGSDVQVELSGVDYHDDKNIVLEELQAIENSFKPGVNLIKICTLHSNVTSSEERLTDFTYKQLSEFNIDSFNCGHWHLQGETGAGYEVNGTLFFNPWNLTRVARDYHVKLDEHIPEFIDCEVQWDPKNKKPVFNWKAIPLEVKPFSEAFNVEAINLLQELQKVEFDFFNTIELQEDEQDMDDGSIMQRIAKEHEISKEAIKIAKGLLT